MQKTTISIVIVAGPGRFQELLDCITSVYSSTYLQFEIILVDNSCSQSLYARVKKNFPKVQIIRMPSNTGIFAYNVGFANAKGKYILALDDDCSILRDTLYKISKLVIGLPASVGVVTCNMYNPLDKYYYYAHYTALGITDVLTFVGGAVIFKQELFNKVGFYDESFFCWAHEDDFAARVINAGYKIHFEKTIIINHFEKETKIVNKQKIFLIFRNKAWFTIKNFSVILFPLFIIKDIGWFFLFSTLPKSLDSIMWMIWGTFFGYAQFYFPLQKRKVMHWSMQKRYITYFLSLIKIIRTP